MRIGFDVLVEAEFAISEIDRHNDRYDEKRQWFRISCNGDLNKHLGDFCISSVCEYDSRIKQNKPLDDALVPYINRDQYEAVARDFLERYYKEALYEPMYVDPTVLVERMGLTIRQRNITNDCSIFGQIFFTDCDTTYYDENREITLTEEVSAGTIYFDPEFYFLRNLGSVNNTIVHECVHWDKHRKAFELERLYNKEATQIRCQVVGGIKDSKTHTATDYMESQANSLTPRIQMPYTQAKVKAAELIRKYKRQLQTNQLVDVLEPVIDEMAIFFGVSRCAAKIRMVDIGYEEAIGVFTYIGGKYVRPHGFKKGSINKQQTFSISAQDAIIEGFFSEELREGMKQGKYQFIDSHYCLNSPKYIMQGEDKNPCLTEYARLHMDECCVIFDLTIKAVNKYSEAFYTECVLYRDAASNIVFEARYADAYLENALRGLAAAYQANVGAVNAAAAEIPGVYQTARNQTAAASEIARKNFGEYAAAAGLSSGAGGQARLAMDGGLLGKLNTINLGEAEAAETLRGQRAQLETQYREDIARAVSEDGLMRAKLLYEDFVRVDNALAEASMNLAKLAAQAAK